MPTRTWDAESSYRFGFNGMEKDDEMKGAGNSYTTEFRQYDARIGRWLSVDPEFFKGPSLTPYRGMMNNPILLVDPKGLWEAQIKEENGKKKLVLVGQKGDSFKTLREQTRISRKELKATFSKDERKALKESSEITEIGNRFSRINEALNAPNQCKNNCFGSSIQYGKGESPSNQDGIKLPDDADYFLGTEFQEVYKAQWGDIVRYARADGYMTMPGVDDKAREQLPVNGEEQGGTSHFATFLLYNEKGSQLFTKNGFDTEWKIQYSSELPKVYGKKSSLINTRKSGFAVYRYIKK